MTDKTVSACCGAEVETKYSSMLDKKQYTCTKCWLVNCDVVERPTPTHSPKLCPDCHGEGVKYILFGDHEKDVDCKRCEGKGTINPPTETVSDYKNKEEIMNNGGMSKECLVHIYPVGFYRDVNECLLKRWEPKIFTRWFLSSWNRKSYWNGFLCEPLTMPKHMTKCGKGITQGMAFRNYEKMRRITYDNQS